VTDVLCRPDRYKQTAKDGRDAVLSAYSVKTFEDRVLDTIRSVMNVTS